MRRKPWIVEAGELEPGHCLRCRQEIAANKALIRLLRQRVHELAGAKIL
jgi:hypothetical protein